MAIRVLLCLLLVAAALPGRPMAQSIGDRPLVAIADRVPHDAGGIVSLADLAAIRRQIGRLPPALPAEQRPPLAFSPVHAPAALDLSGILQFPDGGRNSLGFSIFEIEQMAGWGELPEAALVMAGLARHRDAIETALTARGFGAEPVAGVTVWHLLDDGEIDIAARMSDPFRHAIGVAQRFAMDGEHLLFARDWPTIRRMLAGGTALGGDPDVTAILSAAHSVEGLGELTEILLFSDPPIGAADAASLMLRNPGMSAEELQARLAAIPGAALPGLPPYLRYGLLAWQDGADVTGAIAIPYATAAVAAGARDRFAARLAAVDSALTGRPFDDLLPGDRRFEVVETGGRAVLLLAFRDRVDIAGGVTHLTFVRTPRARLLQMVLARDLPLLIGIGEGAAEPAATAGKGGQKR